MTPQDVAALMSLVAVIKQISSWPFGIVIFFVVVGPWLFAFLFLSNSSKHYEKQEKTWRKELREKEENRRVEVVKTLEQYRQDVSEIKRLYDSNSRLVVATNEAFKRLEKIYDETVSVISLNTQTQTNLAKTVENNVKAIESNRFCPMAGPDLQKILIEYKNVKQAKAAASEGS